MIRVSVQCTGLSPILMNPASDDLLDQLRTRTTRAKKTDISVYDEAAGKLYVDEEGRPGIPALNLFSCLVEAGRRVGTGKGRTNISTATTTLVPSLLAIGEFFFPFTSCTDWVPDKRRGTNPKGGEMVCIVRPRFDRWVFEFTLEIDETQISEQRIRQLVEVAGSSVGLCDFRPAKRGPFGRFAVTMWAIIEGDPALNGHADVGELVTAK